MNFDMIILNQSIKTEKKYVIWITDSFLIHTETKDVYKDIANGVEKWFDTSNYDKDDNN